jgi:hypothetical protein
VTRLVSSLFLVPCAVLCVIASSAQANTRFVNVGLATGANNGTSWADAFQGVDGIQVGLAAAVPGDEVWVAQGLYKPTATLTRTIAINLKSGVSIYGGFAGTETSLAQRDFVSNVTTLSGDLAGNDGSSVFTDNSIHVLNGVSAPSSAVLDGFTVTGGNANIGSSNQDRGGGILLVSNSNGTIRHCIFRANRCTFGGGAGYINASSPTFTDCRFENNVGGSFGGAFDQATNVATNFTRCVFSGNTAGRAGAIEIFSNSPVKVYDCLFFNNSCTASGGGGAVFVSASTPSFRNCTIFGNTSSANAAAGIINSGSSVEVSNCIVYGNTAPGGAQGSANQLGGSPYNVTYSCVQGGFAGTGNISTNPTLANTGGGDFHLTLASPCIDSGNNATIPPALTTDLDNRPRQTDEPTVADTGAGSAPIVDMGAYEFPVPSVMLYCAGDGASGVQCPCGNNSAFFADEGCVHSLGLGGRVRTSGVARILSDTLVLVGDQMPNASCLYFQGTVQVNGGAGAAFGDGLRCVGGAVVRLGTKSNVGGTSQYPVAGDPSISVRVGVVSPGVRNYQIWYRNAAAFCTPSTFNLTNAVQVSWEL